ncbi:MAG: hypothetical protein LH606_13880, partial [Cytophagaceae bacterium]|nr:hypothetical protein [Cytophagaceae bacterium]
MARLVGAALLFVFKLPVARVTLTTVAGFFIHTFQVAVDGHRQGGFLDRHRQLLEPKWHHSPVIEFDV